MKRRLTVFSKVAVLILSLIALMMVLFTVYNRNTIQVIQKEIETDNLNKLMFLKNELEDKVNQISINSLLTSNDPAIRELEYLQQSGTRYDRNKWKNMILDHISLQSGIHGWRTEITVYSRLAGEVISTSSKVLNYEDEELLKRIRRGWQYQMTSGSGKSDSFVWYSVSPESAYEHPEKARLIVQTSFAAEHLENLLDRYKADGQGEPLLYSTEHGMIGNRTLDDEFGNSISEYLSTVNLEQHEPHLSVSFLDQQYRVNILPLYGMNWYLIDSIPVEKILEPVRESRNQFYIFSMVVLGFGVLAAYILYRQIQVPIRELMRSMYGIKRGNYSARIRRVGDGEFSFLYQRFNDMADEIQELLEKVYEERLRSREAVLKQLQSQINPHFLYNCLFYIKNMARLGDEEAVVAMALNLGDYFRYTTRLAKPTAILKEEIDVIINYLEIQNLRTKRFSYEINVPETLKCLEIPRLLLQPIVENAILHGLEPKVGPGHIAIRGEDRGSEYRLFIEDDGVGMDEDTLNQLQNKIESAENHENASFGLWNVNQRLKLMFGEGSGLQLSAGEQGGTVATVIFCLKEVPAACSES